MTDSDHIMAEIAKVLPPEKNGEHLLVDASIDCVGYECCGAGKEVDKRVSEQVLNTCFKVTKAGGGIGVPGIYPVMVRSTLVSAQTDGSTAAAIASRDLIELSFFAICLSGVRSFRILPASTATTSRASSTCSTDCPGTRARRSGRDSVP
jgi:hypothetical protein